MKGLLRSIGKKVRSDLRAAITAPYRAYLTVRYAIEDVRDGDRTATDVAKSAGATVGAVFMVILLLFPLYWILAASLAADARLMSSEGIFPSRSEFGFGAYRWVLTDSDFFYALGNSLIVVTVTITVGFAMIVPGAYALSRRQFVGRKKILYGYVLFTQVGAGLGIAALIALYAIFSNFGLTNNLVVLGVFYAAGAVPFNTWLLKTYMDNIPVSYEEAAVVDGAGLWDTLREIIIPLSKPGLAVVLIFLWLAGWNEFIIAQTMLRPENYTLSVELYQLATAGRYETPWTEFAAFAILFAAPVAIIYFLAQRYVESGLSFGGMEG
ncbi:sugar ABC transporter permease [Halovivax sp.]|uniref:sugar ABC transporter permease n=1 Tax=Halovivax sp. TaxID=1935978 RepID=UPI0025C041EF|nr:ABC transporter permease subunit [Halovivax sp.]